MVTVHGDSEAEVAAAVRELCELAGLTPSSAPHCWAGSDRWIARATATTKAPARDGRG